MAIPAKPPLLYSFRRCPYAIRARMALHYSGVVCELREVELNNKPAEMLALSAKGTVPVLAHAAWVIDESNEIIAWALAHADPENWSAYGLSHALIQKNDSNFKQVLDRYKYFDRYPQLSQQEYFVLACGFIEELESSLQCNQRGNLFLLGTAVSVLDIAIFPFVRQFAFVDKPAFDALPFNRVKQWLDYFLESKLFSAVMCKYPPWQRGQAPIYFGDDELWR